MIQRIQSIFLLLASVALWLLFMIPFALSDKSATPFFEDHLFSVQDHVILLVLCILGASISLINIFLYNNRVLQLRLGIIGIIASFFLGLVAIWLIYSNADKMSDVVIEDQFGIFLPVIAIILLVLANRFIKKDEDLVDSMDRLR
jgi:hypothetical protein